MYFSRTSGASRKAFTLIELLVVVSIIALLIGILLPSLSKARESARALKCGTILRTMGQSNAFYQNDFNGWHVPQSVGMQPDEGQWWGNGRIWAQNKAFREGMSVPADEKPWWAYPQGMMCPTSAAAENSHAQVTGSNRTEDYLMHRHYGHNIGVGVPTPFGGWHEVSKDEPNNFWGLQSDQAHGYIGNEVLEPSQTIHFADSIGFVMVFYDIAAYQNIGETFRDGVWVSWRHNYNGGQGTGLSNALMFDGHVEGLTGGVSGNTELNKRDYWSVTVR